MSGASHESGNVARRRDSGERTKLLEKGLKIFGPADGSQACGDVGPGRMLDPDLITLHTAEMFKHDIFTGRNVLITAGPTREDIDPVRFISNHSSGKMAYAPC